MKPRPPAPDAPLVLLFYDGYDRQARPGRIGGMKAQARYLLRHAKRSLWRQQVHTGFYTAFQSLCLSLRRAGCEVRVNDFAAARARPHHPIGIAGYPSVLNRIDLPNPRIFGPGDFGAPPASALLAADDRYVTLLQPSDWFASLYRPFCADKLQVWFAGLDTQRWADDAAHPKRVDFIVYDKIYWRRSEAEEQVLRRVLAHLDARGLTCTLLRYGHHHQSEYRAALKTARALLFLSHSETQGIAYQEAMSAGLPVLAWDEGVMLDPGLSPYVTAACRVTSVPYFDETCGLTFRMDEFETQCDRFWASRASFRPRDYVKQHLSLEQSAQHYLNLYTRIMRRPAP